MLIHGWQVCTKTVLNTMYINYNTPQNSTHNYWGGGGGGMNGMSEYDQTHFIPLVSDLSACLFETLSSCLSDTVSRVGGGGGEGDWV